MIKSFEIKNFRCFGHIKANGFSRINLISGKNNAGKTALLEAILLMGKPSNRSIASLLAFRGIGIKSAKINPEKAWDSFFYQLKKDNEITFNFDLEEKSGNKVSLNCKEAVADFISMINEDTQTSDKDILEFTSNFTNTKSTKSFLNITAYSHDNEVQKNTLVATPNGRIGRGMEYTFIEINFIPTNHKFSSEQLAKEFDDAKLEKKSKFLLKAFQIIDPSIEEIDTFSSEIQLSRVNEDFMLLSLFGDAMNRMADFVLKIINNQNSILLIDEIENGIHYKNQEEVWRILFDLCKEFNVQLFATSHSYEMIEAFKDFTVNNDRQDQAGYFEMLKHPNSDQTIIQKIPISVLENKLNNKKPVRGEKTNKKKSS